MKGFATLGVLVALVSAPAARADVYACKDREGVVRFADRKLRGMRCVLYAKTPAQAAPEEVAAVEGTEAQPTRPASSRAETRRLANGSPFSTGPFGKTRPESPPPIAPGESRGLGNEPERLEERERLYAPFIEEAATLYRLPVEFVAAVIRVESNYRYRATSEKGAMGLMQLMPSVVREMGVSNPWDPRANVMGGARLLRVLADRFDGDLVKVLAAYHAGSGAVKGAEGIPYEATESYVRSVLDRYYEYRSRRAD